MADSSEIAVGVTGHRVLAEPGLIRAAVNTALNQIAQSYPGRTITVLSSLAEGADRLVVREREALARPGMAIAGYLTPNMGNFVYGYLVARDEQFQTVRITACRAHGRRVDRVAKAGDNSFSASLFTGTMGSSPWGAGGGAYLRGGSK